MLFNLKPRGFGHFIRHPFEGQLNTVHLNLTNIHIVNEAKHFDTNSENWTPELRVELRVRHKSPEEHENEADKEGKSGCSMWSDVT